MVFGCSTENELGGSERNLEVLPLATHFLEPFKDGVSTAAWKRKFIFDIVYVRSG